MLDKKFFGRLFMLPDPILGFIHMYGLMIAIGILAAFGVLEWYGKKVGLSGKMRDFIFYNALVSIAVGLGSAAVFQGVYEYIKYPEKGFHIDGSITFLGGLIGGTVCFLLGYAIFKKRLPENLSKLLQVAPCCITVAHGFGRIGCFFAGCCYGKPTDSWFGVKFPDLPGKVHPTQLYEAIFLFILFGVLTLLLFRKKGRYTFSVYLTAYGIFRFLIEFLRDDERGAFIANLSPSQFWSILLIIIGIVYTIVASKKEDEK